MGLKVLGNYLDQFWSNTISVLLFEGTKSPNSMVSGFLTPGEPLFMDLINIPRDFKHIRKNETFSEIFV